VKHEHAVAIVASRFITSESAESEMKDAVKTAADILELAAEEVRSRQEMSRDEPHVVSPGGRKRPSVWSLSQ
jgi:hypothetical protein